MTFVDHAIKESTISSEDTVIDMQEFVDFMRIWFEKNNYKINEKVYLALLENKTQIKWECTKKPEDYHKFEISVKFDLKASQEAKGKRKLSKGTVKFVYSAKLIRDFDNKWLGAWKYITRAIYDRFIVKENEVKVVKELEKDVSKLSEAVKKYLGL